MKRSPLSRAKRAIAMPSRGAGATAPPGDATVSDPVEWLLHLYVAGQTPKSFAAFGNLKDVCEQHLAGRYRIEVIDLSQRPHLAQENQIVALPTVVRHRPKPTRCIIGNFADRRFLLGMDLPSALAS